MDDGQASFRLKGHKILACGVFITVLMTSVVFCDFLMTRTISSINTVLETRQKVKELSRRVDALRQSRARQLQDWPPLSTNPMADFIDHLNQQAPRDVQVQISEPQQVQSLGDFTVIRLTITAQGALMPLTAWSERLSQPAARLETITIDAPETSTMVTLNASFLFLKTERPGTGEAAA